MSDLLKEWLSQEWDESCHQAFEELKSKLSSPLVLKSRSLTNLLRCIWGRVTLALADVDARCMAIAYESIKLDA